MKPVEQRYQVPTDPLMRRIYDAFGDGGINVWNSKIIGAVFAEFDTRPAIDLDRFMAISREQGLKAQDEIIAAREAAEAGVELPAPGSAVN